MTPMHPIRISALLVLAALGAGCATHQLRLQPLRGLSAEEAAEVQRGRLGVGCERLLDAAATTLEHEPYFHWDIDVLDRANGFIKASAGLLREVQIRVSGQGDDCRLSVSVPRRELKARAKVWIRPDGSASAYEPPAADLAQCRVLSADVTLDDQYFYAFTWHALHDHAEVPFDLVSYDDGTSAASSATAPALALQAEAPVALSPSVGVALAPLSPSAAQAPAALSPAAAEGR